MAFRQVHYPPKWPAFQSTFPEPNTLGYGFDDCSHNAFYYFWTQQQQKASTSSSYIFCTNTNQLPHTAMYYIGGNVQDWPTEAQRALADGHEICIRKSPFQLIAHFQNDHHISSSVNTWSHSYMTAVPSKQASAEMWYTVSSPSHSCPSSDC